MAAVPTRIAGNIGSRMSSAVGKAASHIRRAASPPPTADVLDPKVIREGVDSMAAGRLAEADANFKRAVTRWGYSSDAAYLGDDLNIIRQATRQSHLTSDSALYRGVKHASGVKHESILAGGSDVVDWDALQVGSEFRLGATSWSTNRAVGETYAGAGARGRPMGTVLEMPAGSKGLKFGTGAEAEFVTEGKFRVASIDASDVGRPRRVALERVDDVSGAIKSGGKIRTEEMTPAAAEAFAELRALSSTSSPPPPPSDFFATRPTPMRPPTPDKSMMSRPRHSSARSGLPKRSLG